VLAVPALQLLTFLLLARGEIALLSTPLLLGVVVEQALLPSLLVVRAEPLLAMVEEMVVQVQVLQLLLVEEAAAREVTQAQAARLAQAGQETVVTGLVVAAVEVVAGVVWILLVAVGALEYMGKALVVVVAERLEETGLGVLVALRGEMQYSP
jgi:hypothetical protein